MMIERIHPDRYIIKQTDNKNRLIMLILPLSFSLYISFKSFANLVILDKDGDLDISEEALLN